MAGDTNASSDVFVHDRQTGATERVSVDSAGGEGNSFSFVPVHQCRRPLRRLYSCAGNLVAGDTNTSDDVFVHDRLTGATERVSVDSAGGEGNSGSIPVRQRRRPLRQPSLGATIWWPGDTNTRDDVFVHDRQTGATERVSVDNAGGK